MMEQSGGHQGDRVVTGVRKSVSYGLGFKTTNPSLGFKITNPSLGFRETNTCLGFKGLGK